MIFLGSGSREAFVRARNAHAFRYLPATPIRRRAPNPPTMFTTVRAFRSRLLLRVALTLAAASPLLAASPAPGFEHEVSDLKPDPVARFGTLDNGVRYVVYPNHEPKGRASLRLLVLAGSLQENDQQQGLAHFLEHMAFKGSTHYPPGTLVERLQRMGMRFGADTNASTSFDRTLYLLELPDTNEATLQDGCQIFADYADGLLLQPDQITAEAGSFSARSGIATRSISARRSPE